MYDRTSSDLVSAVTTAKKAKNFGNGGSPRLGGVKRGRKGSPLKC